MIGLFGVSSGTLRNIGLEEALASNTRNDNATKYTAPLMGIMAGGTLINSYASGRTSIQSVANNAGGLVGEQRGGEIIASHATSRVDKGNGELDAVGGLIGKQKTGGAIIASYATGNAISVNDMRGNGINDWMGGLVGLQEGGTITASYATGNVDSGVGSSDHVGGLVGRQSGTITASYATGNVDSGTENNDSAGGLAGSQSGGTLTASYGFGTVVEAFNDGIDRSQATTATSAATLTLANAGAQWNQDSSGTLNAWDFSDNNHPPALLYNDYDGDGGTNYCGTDPDDLGLFVRANIRCGTLIPGQRATTAPRLGIDTDTIQLARGDTTHSITASILLPSRFTVDGRTIDLMWSVHHDPDATHPVTLGSGILLVDTDRRATTRTVILRATSGGALVNDYHLRILAGSEGLQNPGLRFTSAVDTLALGTRHDFGATRASNGAITYGVTDMDGNATDLATIDGNGQLTANNRSGTIVITATVDPEGDYRGATTRHRLDIRILVDADSDGLIDIHNLTMLHNMRHNLAGTSYKSTAAATGLTFGCPDATPDDGVVNEDCIGYELVGDLDFDLDRDGRTWDSATLALDAGDDADPYFDTNNSDTDNRGWLPIGTPGNPFSATFEGNGFVIRNLAIRRSQAHIGLFGYTTGTLRNLGLEEALAYYTGSTDSTSYIGILVGYMRSGTLIASYASGRSDGSEHVAGLVGLQAGGAIIASHSSGRSHGRTSTLDAVAGLVGRQDGGTLIASYATGNVDGGSGDHGSVGGLVGWLDGGSITASYATGDVDGGAGPSDNVASLIGNDASGTHTASYGFGTTANGSDRDGAHRSRTTTATSAETLTLANAGTEWNNAGENTLGAWEFGDSNQHAALLYNDYDGSSGTDYCAFFAAANTPCGTLIPGQRTATTPRFDSGAGNIQLADDDTPGSVTANITLPASITVDGTATSLTWSVHHDPETTAANRAIILGNQLIVDSSNRLSTRRVILRATTTGGTIVNDYHVRILVLDDGLQDPGLRFTSTVDTLMGGTTHDFGATNTPGVGRSPGVSPIFMAMRLPWPPLTPVASLLPATGTVPSSSRPPWPPRGTTGVSPCVTGWLSPPRLMPTVMA